MTASLRLDPILWLSIAALCLVGIGVICLATWDFPGAGVEAVRGEMEGRHPVRSDASLDSRRSPGSLRNG